MKIDRHKAAISRNELSKPVFAAIQQKVLKPDNTFFDYGCGKGSDVSILQDQGYKAIGWDPYHASESKKQQADVINLGYVINVIEDPIERKEVLKDAFQYADQCLIVSAQVLTEDQQTQGESFEDGIVTKRNTFQKYYSQSELHTFIAETLKVDPIPACLGVFYVFKDEKNREHFLSDKYIRKYICRPRQFKSLEEKLEPYKDLLEEFANTVENLGRLPKSDEFTKYNKLKLHIGSPKKALTFCEQLFDDFDFTKIAKNRYNDILVYISVSSLRGKFKQSNLDDGIKKDIKIIFGSIAEVKAEASHLIHQLRDHKNIYKECGKSTIGKLLPDSLYIHVDYINSLSPLLRLYISCATIFTGELADATLIKINRNKRKISFLYYDDFDRNPHPKLLHSTVVDLGYLTVKDWIQSKTNPPILHRKETFVGKDYPGRNKFEKLTRQEEKAELFNSGKFIGRENNWNELVKKSGYQIKGHKLIKIKA